MPRRAKESVSSATTSNSNSASITDTLSSLNDLPSEIRCKLERMAEMDQSCANLQEEAEKLISNYLKNVKRMSKGSRVTSRAAINKITAECFTISDEKVSIARELSEFVDGHIKRLDESLSKYEDAFFEYLANPSKQRKKVDFESSSKIRKGASGASNQQSPLNRNDSPVSSAHRELTLLTHSILKHAVPLNGPVPASNYLPARQMPFDMPLDPNEPTYCICHNVSYGEMVGCDNPDCVIEWFHYACVGLEEQPDGDWYCPRCSEFMPKEKLPEKDEPAKPKKKFSRK